VRVMAEFMERIAGACEDGFGDTDMVEAGEDLEEG
jgi:hypothetical protein